MRRLAFTRRQALACLASWQASLSSSAIKAQELIGEPPGRIAPLQELINVPEFQPMARRKLFEAAFARIADGERKAFDRITFRPRLMVDVSNLSLSTELFGQTAFAPVLVGPVGRQGTFHPEAELATVRGASLARSVAIISSDSSAPLEKILPEAKSSAWFQVYSAGDPNAIVRSAQKAVDLGAKVVCISLGLAGAEAAPGGEWALIDQLRKRLSVPVVLKGIMSPDEARLAVGRGIRGIVVSNHGRTEGFAEPISVLPAIAEAVQKKATILVDGGFRRGTDIMKALAFGANGVLIARPVMWGLAAYGAEGVQAVIELLQSELARTMAMCGRPTLGSIDSSVVRLHSR